MPKAKLLLLASAFALAGTTQVSAQQMVYTPINPTFGGSPFNSAHLLGVAGAQNGFKDPLIAANAFKKPTQSEIFAQQLQSILLSRLAQQVSEAIFGPNPQQNGTVVFGTQTITFTRTLESVLLTISDSATGQTTNITVPTLQPTCC